MGTDPRRGPATTSVRLTEALRSVVLDIAEAAATKNGLPRRSFAFAPSADPDTWRLPFLDADGLPDPRTLPLSAASLAEASTREGIPSVLLPAIKAKMRQAYRRMGQDGPEAIRETAHDVAVVDAALTNLVEGSGDHFYGAWTGGKASSGGHPAAGGSGGEKAGEGKAKTTDTAAGPAKPASAKGAKWGQGPTVDAQTAYDALSRGESPNVHPKDVRSFLAIAAAGDGHPDLTKLQVAGTMKFGGDGLGIKRADMPQLPGDRLPEFVAHMRAQGVTVTEERVDPAKLKPIQSEVSSKKVGGMLNAMRDGTLPGGSIVITKDDFVLDGHHRWGAGTALSFERSGVQLDAVRIGMDAKPLLSTALSWTEAAGIERRGIAEALREAWDAAFDAHDFRSLDDLDDDDPLLFETATRARRGARG